MVPGRDTTRTVTAVRATIVAFATGTSLPGSSWFAPPRGLHWLTGNTGLRHDNPRAPWLTVWDDARARLVRYRDAERAGGFELGRRVV
jgi:hypothetical protein